MRVNLFVIYDLVARTSVGMIMQQRHDAAAIRDFHSVLGDTRTVLGQAPSDYELRCVGSMDTETSDIEGSLRTVATGAAWFESQNRVPALVKETA